MLGTHGINPPYSKMTENRSGKAERDPAPRKPRTEENSRFPKIPGMRLPNPQAGQDNRLRLRARLGTTPGQPAALPGPTTSWPGQSVTSWGPPRTTPGQFSNSSPRVAGAALVIAGLS